MALLTRLAWLRGDSTFQRTDEVMFLLNAARLDGLFATASPAAAVRELFWMVAFPWGYPVLVFTYAIFAAHQWLGIPVTEFSLVAPFAVVGALAPALVYLLARRAFPAGVALAAALAVALLPSHVAQSRTVASWLLASNLMMLTLLAGWRYFEGNDRRRAVLFGLALACYLPSDNLMPGTLLVLAMVAFFWHPGSPFERLRATVRAVVRPAVIVLPALSVGVLVAVQAAFVLGGRPTYGFLGHYLAGKVDRGVNVWPVLQALWANTEPALVALVGIGLVRAALTPFRPGRQWVFLCWLLGFLLPTVLLVNPRGTLIQGYLTPVLLPVMVFGAAGFVEGTRAAGARLGRWGPAVVTGMAAVALFGLALAAVPPRIYDRPFLGLAARPIGLWGGEQYPNNGAKTAGYWIRKHTPPGTVVLSDLRLFVGKYYFHRPTIAPSDPRFALDRFREVRDRVGLVAVTAGFTDTARAAGYLEGYHLVLTVTHRDRAVFYAFGREPRPPQVWRAEDVDGRFDREFGRAADLRYPVIWEDDLPPLTARNAPA